MSGTWSFRATSSAGFFISFGGSVQKNHLYGYAGEPRLGLACVPVRPGPGLLRGTKLRANVATGVQEPSLATEFTACTGSSRRLGDTADIALTALRRWGRSVRGR